jgi:hypothetical protein
MADRYLLESSTTDGYLLEDGSGVLLLENIPAGPNNQTDWPNPRLPRALSGKNRSTDLLTWTRSPLQTPLIGKYTLMRAPLYTRIEPKGYPVSLRHWDQGNMLALNAPVSPFAKIDWPNPLGAKQPIQWQAPSLLGTLLQPLQSPFAMTDWPVPNGPRFPIDLRTWTETTLYLLGKDQFFGLAGNPTFDWPVPKGPVPVIDLKTWTKNTTYLLGKDQFFGLAGHPNFDWPNPRGPIPAIDLKTWLENITYLIGKDTLPEPNYDWPNPRGKVPAIDLRTWIKSTLYLLGKDQLPEQNLDWPNPRGARFPVGLLTPLQIDLLNTLLVVTGTPFSQLAWPNPRGAMPGQPWAASTNPNLLPPTPPPTGEQLRQIIRFAPIAFGGKTHWGR